MKPYSKMLIVAVAFSAAFAADLNRGRELYNEGNYSAAVTELQAVVGENAENAEAHRLLGMALIEQDRVSDAEKHVNRAMELDPSGESKLAAARLAVARKNYDHAEELIGEASGGDLEYVRGLLHFNRNRFEEAATDLEAAIGKRPGNAYAHYYAGLAYNKTGKPDRMLSHFEMFVKLKPDAPEARKVRAVLKTGR
jgi:tetratricopeptide (TPR) repeat protein